MKNIATESTLKRTGVLLLLGIIGTAIVVGVAYATGFVTLDSSLVMTDQPTQAQPVVAQQKEAKASEFLTLRLYKNPDCNDQAKKPDQEVQMLKGSNKYSATYLSSRPLRYIDTIDGFIYLNAECEGPAHGATSLLRYNPQTKTVEAVGQIGRRDSWYFPKLHTHVSTNSNTVMALDLTDTAAGLVTVHTLKEGETFDRTCEFVCDTNMTPSGDTVLEYDVFAEPTEVTIITSVDTIPVNKFLRRERLDIKTGKVEVK